MRGEDGKAGGQGGQNIWTAVVGPCLDFSLVVQIKIPFFKTVAQSGIFEYGNFLLFVSTAFPGNTV